MRSKSFWLLAGGILFAWILWRTGLSTIERSFTEVGWAYLWILLWPLSYYFFYTLGWQLTFPAAHRTLSVGALLRARLIGEAVNYLTPLGNIGGEPIRALQLKGRMPLAVTTATMILDRTLYFLATVVFIVAGIGIALWRLELSAHVRLACWITLVGFSLALFLLLFIQQIKAFTGAVRFLSRFAWARRRLVPRLPHLETLEKTMEDFYRRRPAAFAGATVANFLGRACGTIEIWLILYFLGAFSQNSSWQQGLNPLTQGWFDQWSLSLLIAVFVVVINTAFFMFPSQLGVAEGSTALLFRLLGLNPALGVALQLVKRVKSFAYILLGLWLANRTKAAASREGVALS